MKNIFKLAFSLFLFTLTAFSFSACSDDDDDVRGYSIDDIAGMYTGTLDPYATTSGAARAYAEVTKRGKDSFSITITCSKYAEYIGNSYEINVIATSTSDGNFTLTPENDNIAFTGDFLQGSLSMTFRYANNNFKFVGTK